MPSSRAGRPVHDAASVATEATTVQAKAPLTEQGWVCSQGVGALGASLPGGGHEVYLRMDKGHKQHTRQANHDGNPHTRTLPRGWLSAECGRTASQGAPMTTIETHQRVNLLNRSSKSNPVRERRREERLERAMQKSPRSRHCSVVGTGVIDAAVRVPFPSKLDDRLHSESHGPNGSSQAVRRHPRAHGA